MKPAIWFAAGAACALILGKSVPVAFGGGTIGNAAVVSWDSRVAAAANGDVYERDATGYHYRGNALANHPSNGRVVSVEYFVRVGGDFAWLVLNTGEQYRANVIPDSPWVFQSAGNMFDVIPRPAGPSPIAVLNFTERVGGFMLLESGGLYGAPGGATYPRDYVGNIFANVPVGVDNTTWSKVKSSYR